MALLDQNLVFSNAQAITATAASTNAYDIETGLSFATSFTQPNDVIGNATFFGEDLGLGRGKGAQYIEVYTGAGTPAAATSLNIQVRGAPNNATAFSSLNRSDLTFVVYVESGAIVLASILASRHLSSLALPRRLDTAALPRFYDLNYVVAGSNFTGLTVKAYLSLGDTSAQDTLPQYASNY